MESVQPHDVAVFAGRSDDEEFVAAATAALPVVASMVRSYVRDRGFTNGEPDEALQAVIVSSCARLAANPEGNLEESLGAYRVRPGVFNGWTLPELAILRAYRVTAR